VAAAGGLGYAVGPLLISVVLLQNIVLRTVDPFTHLGTDQGRLFLSVFWMVVRLFLILGFEKSDFAELPARFFHLREVTRRVKNEIFLDEFRRVIKVDLVRLDALVVTF